MNFKPKSNTLSVGAKPDRIVTVLIAQNPHPNSTKRVFSKIFSKTY